MKPKGKILLIGGTEHKGDGQEKEIAERNKQYRRFEILEELVPRKKTTQ